MNPRLAAARALAPVLGGRASLAGSLPPLLGKVPPRDRALVQELAFGSARFAPRLQALLGKLLQKPLKAADQDIAALLLVGLYQLLYSRIPPHAAIGETVGCAQALHKPWAKALVNAVLRRAQREGQALLAELDAKDQSARCAHPVWLLEKLQKAYPQDWQDICAANNARPPMTLRVNLRQVSRDAYAEELAAAGIACRPCRFGEAALLLDEAVDVVRLPGFATGRVSVQDEAAQLAAPFLQLAPGQRVLDACAAPGGKTGHLLESEPSLGQVLALDVDEKRLQRVQENLSRLNLSGCRLLAADAGKVERWWDGKLFDRILLDAPCSATGVIRRHPDIKLTRRADDIAALARQQGQLLDALWPCLADGGLLLYATCSVLPEENSEVIGAFLARTKSAEEEPLELDFGFAQPHGRQLLPSTAEAAGGGQDGFYYASLRKKIPA